MLAAEYKAEACLIQNSLPNLAIYKTNGEYVDILSYKKGKRFLLFAINEIIDANKLIDSVIDRIDEAKCTIEKLDFSLRNTDFSNFMFKLVDIASKIQRLHIKLGELKALEFPPATKIAEELSSQLIAAFPEVNINQRHFIKCHCEDRIKNVGIIDRLNEAEIKLLGSDEVTGVKVTGVTDYLDDMYSAFDEVFGILETERFEFVRRKIQIREAKKYLKRRMTCLGKWYYINHWYKVY